MVGARTLFIMGDLDHLQGHDLEGIHLVSTIIPERFKLHSPYLHQICIMIRAKTLFIMDDFDLDLQGHSLDPQPGDYAPALQSYF